jgi:hypothetical protein
MCFLQEIGHFLVYDDDAIIMSPQRMDIDISLQDVCKSLNQTDGGDNAGYLGIKVVKLSNKVISLTQPHLIARTLRDIKFSKKTKRKNIPAVSTHLLQQDPDGEAFNEHWDCRSVMGMLNF